MNQPMLRILDANFNRAREGLRACEEYARFVLENPNFSGKLKNCRHALQGAETLLASAAGTPLAAARDTAGDCGTSLKTAAENSRAGGEAVLSANLKRAEEALRVLSEYGKTLSGEAAEKLEKIRYELYDLEPLLTAGGAARAKLQQSRLYVLITKEFCAADPLTVCREAVDGGADIIQFREKTMEDGEFYRLAAAMQEICGSRALFIINDRVHIAQLLNSPGLHTGQGDLPLHLSRRLLGADKIIGISTAAPAAAETAAAANADYLGVGPVFPTDTKLHASIPGMEYLRWAVKNVAIPYFCIGSINRETLETILQAGARRAAICTAIIGAKDIAGETAWFREKMAAYPL